MIAFAALNLDGLLVIILSIMFGPPLIMTIIGFVAKKDSPKAAKVLFILAALYLVIGLGICGGML